MIEFTCSCGKEYRVRDEFAGRRRKCKSCGATIQVPHEKEQTELIHTEKQQERLTCPYCAEVILANVAKCSYCGERLTGELYSYVLPDWHFVLLSILTFNIYQIYWFYRNWKHLKVHNSLDIRPGWRTAGLFVPIYGLVLVYRQLREILYFSEDARIDKTYSPGRIFCAWAIFNSCWILPPPFSLLPSLSVLPFAVVQGVLNSYWKEVQPELTKRKGFSGRQISLLAIGGIFWIFALTGTIISEYPSLIPRVFSRSPDSALIAAVFVGHTESVKVLLNKGADPNAKFWKGSTTVLMIAAMRGHTDAAQVLLDNGADVNAKADTGWTALIWAAGRGHTDIVRLLLAKGADPNVRELEHGATALIFAAFQGHTDIMKALLEKGADVNAKDKNGRTALMIVAAAKGHADTVLLLKNPPRPVELDEQMRKSRERQERLKSRETARKELAELGIAYDPDEFASRVKNGDIAVVELFLAAGMDPDVKKNFIRQP